MKEIRQNACPLDCPDSCSLDVEIDNDRVAAIRGNHRNAVTQGFICDKISRFDRRLYGPDRLLFPQRRCGAKSSGRFERISWQDAVTEIADRLSRVCRQYGGEAVLPYFYGGSNGLMTQGLVDAHFFRRLGASRLARTLCAASTTAAAEALYGRMPGTAFQDYIHSKFILIWGANPAHSNIHLVPYLKKAHLGGALIAVVDPRRIFSADMVDIFIQPRPGSDVAIALAMIRHLNRQGGVAYGFLREHSVGWEQLLEQAESFSLERAASISDVPAADIARLAETYAEISPAVVRCGWGLERNRNGLAAVAAVLALPAVIGKFGQVGGGYTLSNSGAFKVDDAKQAGLPESNTRLLNMCQLGQILDGDIDPPVKTLFIYNANPVAAVPDANRIVRGLMRSDLFTVVLDQVHTDTCAYADILLPATTFLEHTEVAKSYGSYTLHVSAPVVTPAGESKCNAEVFQMLGRAMGWKDGLFVEEPQSLLQRALSAIQMPFGTGLKLESLQPSATLNLEFSGGRPVQFVNVFPNTPDGKIHLYPAALGSQPYSFYENPAGDHFPLILISPATNKTINSTLGEYNLRQVYVGMHPQDAAQRNLKSGDVVQVHNDRGEIRVTLKIDARLRPGVVFLPKGFWQRATLNKAVSTALVPDHVTPISGGACFNDARVQVSKGSVIK